MREPVSLVAIMVLALLPLFLSACATRKTTVAEPAPPAWLDVAYPAPTVPVPADIAQRLFAMSPAMAQYAASSGLVSAAGKDQRQALLQALYHRQQLRLRYDDSRTRSAAEAFEQRAGNCLSLVIMTAAFAKHLGLPVSYQRVDVEDSYSRQGSLQLASGHVNLVLAQPQPTTSFRHLYAGRAESHALTVDFLPAREIGPRAVTPLPEHTLVAMYLNNRAAEFLVQGDSTSAYWWARAAALEDPQFLPVVNTLGLVHFRSGHLQPALAALNHAVARDSDNYPALSNLALTLRKLAREREALAIEQRMAQIKPHAPFAHYDLGRAAMTRADYASARELFAKELRLQPEQHEVLFWAALADWHLGDWKGARRHMERARINSPNPDTEERYATKIERLRGATPSPALAPGALFE
jgi:tetratricopeptide (TPR) repeat protein